ncbi:beta-ketoacyl synthase domain-containing protein [Seiridium cupressi]
MYKKSELEPIAIIGSSCRFAGQATSPSKLWQVLANPSDLSKEVPSNRFNAQAFYHEDGEHHGTTNSIKAYWLEQDHRVFDASFFNITPKEAEAIDPQQRLLLEVVYEAMEAAGFTLNMYSGKNVGVFAGVMTADYDTLSQRDELSASQYYATGNARSIISNRVSYFFNFRGPSMTIDTACSSSLVALHQAVLSLRSGEIPMACVTGVNLMITPEQFIVESSLHMLSPTGKSRMWDQSADGYARGEGVAAIFLKPLSLALHDGDDVLGIIRQTGVNSDGRTPGITMPNPDAQASLIRSTYRTSGLDPQKPEDRCQYFEAHGTGTQAGDPREAQAIHEAFFGSVSPGESDTKLLVGSVKTVIGHTEGAAGLAGVLKVLLAMKNGKVPPNLHLDNLNPTVQPFYHNLEIPTSLVAWPEPPHGQPRRASVNSFGFGGTNSHAIVEAYVPEIHDSVVANFSDLPRRQALHEITPNQTSRMAISPTSLPLLMSASSQKSLRGIIHTWRSCLAENPRASLQQLAWSLCRHRTALPYKVSVAASSKTDAIKILDAMLESASENAELGVRSSTTTKKPRILGIFTGQGAQWPSMSRQLLLSNQRYRDTIHQLDQILQQSPDPPSWSLEGQIMAEGTETRIHEAQVSQPLCTALQIGLVDLLKSLGITFQAVVGHSSGEIAAAYAAGRLSARDAMLISYYRGLHAHLAGGEDGQKGAMMAAGMSESEALGFCRDPVFQGKICVAASNAPASVTLSGDMQMIQLAKEKLTKQARFARLLQVDTAYHSPHMTGPAVAYTEALQKCGISPLAGDDQVQWVSSVYGFSQNSEKDLASGYWKDNMVYAVQFFDAVQSALSDFGPFDCALEVGPHPALKGPATQTAKAVLGAPVPYYGLLERSKDDSLALSEFLGSIWCQLGPSALDIEQYVLQSSDPSLVDNRLVDLPSYQWDHSQIHYRESRISRQYHFKHAAPHELLGARTRDDNEFELRWRNILRPDKLPWLEGHSFQGQALVPASAYCVMALDAALQLLDGRSASVVEITDLDIMSGISMESDSIGTEVMFSLNIIDQPKDRAAKGVITASFTLMSCAADGSTAMKKNASGNLSIVLDEMTVDSLPHRQTSLSETLSASTDAFYKMMDCTGLVYSGPFRAIQSIQRRADCASTTLKRRHADDTTQLSVSPATLDSCLQSAFLTWSSPGDKSLWTSFLPTRIARIQFNVALCQKNYKPDAQSILTVDSHLTDIRGSTPDSKAEFTVEVCIFNDRDEMEIEIEGLTVAAFAKTKPEDDHELYLHTVMKLDPTDEIVSPDVEDAKSCIPEIVETCQRIASFYSIGHNEGFYDPRIPSHQSQPSVPTRNSNFSFTNDDVESIDALVSSSPYQGSLRLLQDMGRILPALLPSAVHLVTAEASLQLNLGRHVAKIVDQVCHRYPRMAVLNITDAKIDLAEHVLKGLGSSYLSLTIASLEEGMRQDDAAPKDSHGKIQHRHFHSESDIYLQLDSMGHMDMVIITSSFLGNLNAESTLRRIRDSVNDGGFLLVVQAPESPIREGLRLLTQSPAAEKHDFDPQGKQYLLERCGFTRVARNSDQILAPGVSISVRQAGASFVTRLAKPSTSLTAPSTEKLLIVGLAGEETSSLGHNLRSNLSQACSSIELARCIEDVDLSTLRGSTAAIVLEDLESPVVSNMTEKKLSQLKELFHPNMTVLWLTQNARSDNPDHAATLGFTRTVSAEVPNLKLQVLDLENPDTSGGLIVESFARLVATDPASENSLWVQEPEIYMEKGRRLVPRVLSLNQFNDRANALRRVVTKSANTINEVVRIVPRSSEEGWSGYEVTASNSTLRQSTTIDTTSLRVLQSTMEAVRSGPDLFTHICLGQDLANGETKVALSVTNASYVEVPASLAQPLPETNLTGPQFIHSIMRYLVALTIFEKSNRYQNIIFIDADELLVQCARVVAKAEASHFSSWTTSTGGDSQVQGSIRVHERSSDRQIKALIPPSGVTIFDFSSGSEFSGRLMRLVPSSCDYHSSSAVLTSHFVCGNNMDSRLSVEASSILMQAIGLAAKAPGHPLEFPNETISVSDAVTSTGLPSLVNVMDWTTDRNTTEIVKPLVEQELFSPRKTYVLVGLTRDFGQSLSRLFIKHGARHIVLASRNPDTSPKWKDELHRMHGAHVNIEKLDVTSLDSVLQFKSRIEEVMPPVGGVINGAMVLDDRVFSQMTVETWNRTLRPKSVGSKNLDVAFSDPGLEFFVMTSSFAAIGGHPGQSNYAAANMYMNGLAANRRKRGLTGSVLNIGVIYGLGLLQREKEELYVGLEREGYPPISERDIHHMFLEAIVGGRPGTSEPFDITTGLRRFKWGSPNPLHWHLDPRFSHFTVDDGTSESDAEAGAQGTLLDQLATIKDTEQIANRLVDAFTEHLMIMLQLSEGSVNRHNSLSEIGIDSLVAVDIRNWVFKTLGRDVAVLKILGASSIQRFCLDIAEQIHADNNSEEDSTVIDTPSTSRTPSEASGPSSGGNSAADKPYSLMTEKKE